MKFCCFRLTKKTAFVSKFLQDPPGCICFSAGKRRDSKIFTHCREFLKPDTTNPLGGGPASQLLFSSQQLPAGLQNPPRGRKIVQPSTAGLDKEKVQGAKKFWNSFGGFFGGVNLKSLPKKFNPAGFGLFCPFSGTQHLFPAGLTGWLGPLDQLGNPYEIPCTRLPVAEHQTVGHWHCCVKHAKGGAHSASCAVPQPEMGTSPPAALGSSTPRQPPACLAEVKPVCPIVPEAVGGRGTSNPASFFHPWPAPSAHQASEKQPLGGGGASDRQLWKAFSTPGRSDFSVGRSHIVEGNGH